MPSNRSLPAAIFLFSLLIALPAQVFSQATNIIILANVRGSVTVTNDVTGISAPGVNGTQITDQYTIETGLESSVALLFSSGSTVTIAENSRLQVAQFTQEPHEETGRLSAMTREPSISTNLLQLEYRSFPFNQIKE